MNTIWSTYVQKIDTLNLSRKLRFADIFKDKYKDAFIIDGKRTILEIGCGPGALSGSLCRWYPDAEICGTDRDSNFIEFASRQVPGVNFKEEDATHLSFRDGSFDVTISNTVAEHVEPSKFYSEQYRVLKENGICLVLSARRGLNVSAPCITEMSDFEKIIWQKVENYCRNTDEKYNVCAYPMDEAEMPRIMGQYGFRNVTTEYISVNLTPDNPVYSRQMAHDMINANRACAVDGAKSLSDIAAAVVTQDEVNELIRIINSKYDKRIELYDSGIRQWDTQVLLTMILRGVK